MKLTKIFEIQSTLPLTEFVFIEKYKESFLQSELGRIHELLPLKEMADSIRTKMPERKPQGNKPMFPPEGEIALMFLKSYTCMSDDALVEMLNGILQIFCGVLIDPSRPIKDGKEIKHRIVSIDLPYLRPIVRGKENKRGVRSQSQQHTDRRLSFIEHHSFEA